MRIKEYSRKIRATRRKGKGKTGGTGRKVTIVSPTFYGVKNQRRGDGGRRKMEKNFFKRELNTNK